MSAQAAGWLHRRSTQQLVTRVLAHGLAAAGAAVILIPFFWMVASSLKAELEVFAWPPRWLPQVPRWHNYADAWTALPFSRFLANTVFLTVLGVLAEVISSSLVAYGFARFPFRGRDALFVILLSTMMLPFHVTVVPTFVIWTRLGLVNTFDPLVLRAWTAWGPFYIFLLRQFFLGIPRELEDAATIDGAGPVQTFLHVMLPLIKPALLAVGVFTFRGYWNEFLGPLLYLNDLEKYTMTLGMYFFLGGVNEAPQWHWLMAMSTLVALPMLAVFFLAQRYFMEGITLTGLKG